MTIKEICEYYGIQNYTINPDNSIDVDGNVDLFNNNLTKLPLKFNKVFGYFLCTYNNLTSLEGSPIYVGGNFACQYNKLTSLDGCPNYVGNWFNCSDNNLTNLDDCPIYVGGVFNCYANPLPKEIRENPYVEIKRLNREKKLNILLNED
jgi:hypothetical protein